MSKTIDPARLVADVRRLASEHPNKVVGNEEDSSGCVYFEDDRTTGVCIVGCALEAQGLDLTDIAEITNRPMFGIGHGVNTLSIDQFDVWPDPDVESWLSIVQKNQDRGTSWGDAVAEADERMGEYAPKGVNPEGSES